MKIDRKTLLILAGVMVATIIVANVLFKKTDMETNEVVEKTWDSKTDAKIQTMHPLLRAKASKFINEVEKKLGKRLKITDGLRTFAEQDKLYAQGRTTAGKKVTNAKGGQSYHNYGLAFDCYFTKNGSVDFSHAITPEVAKIGQDMGLEWGGKWTSIKDFPHFQLTKGSVSQLLATYNAGKKDTTGYVIV
jgi:peptidoglycan L-alanyl-D-glutamate endopeptidase CwlK